MKRRKTKTRLATLLGEYAEQHPAFPSFVWAMRRKSYGKEEAADAWYWFRDGWNAAEVANQKVVVRASLKEVR